MPSLGTPLEVFVRLGAALAAGVGGTWLFLTVTGAIKSVAESISQTAGGLKAKVAPAKAEGAATLRNPFRSPDEFSAVPPKKGKSKK